MTYKINCADLGADCSWEGGAESKKELYEKVAKHAKEVHDYTDEQLNDPKMMALMEKHVKEE